MRIERALWGVAFVLIFLSAFLLIQFRMGEDKIFEGPNGTGPVSMAAPTQVELWCKEDFSGKKDDTWDIPKRENVHCSADADSSRIHQAVNELGSQKSESNDEHCVGASGTLTRTESEWWLTPMKPSEPKLRVRVTAMNSSFNLLDACDGQPVLMIGILRKGDPWVSPEFFPNKGLSGRVFVAETSDRARYFSATSLKLR